MNQTFTTIATWSYGIAGCAYTAFALYLGFGWRGGARGLALAVAVILTAVWAFLGAGFAYSHAHPLFLLAAVADVLRYGGWCGFLILLLRDPPAQPYKPDARRARWLLWIAGALVALGLIAQLLVVLEWNTFVEPARLVVLDALALAVLGLVLAELLFRNASEDSRWGIASARAAGLRAVGVTTSYDAGELAGADLIIGSLAELDVASLQRLLF